MKFRTDFVTNSSSSSFIYIGYFSKDLLNYLNELIADGYTYRLHGEETMESRGFIASKNTEGAVVDALSYVPYKKQEPFKLGFQIEQEEHQACGNLDALMNFIDTENIPVEKSNEIHDKLEKLINHAEREGLISRDFGEHLTDAGVFGSHFCEIDYDKAFYKITNRNNLAECKNKDLTEALICGGPRCINARAFAKMKHLRSVKILNKWTRKIDTRAFSDCPALEEVILVSGLNEIGSAAFKNCVSLKELYIPSSVYEIASDAFAGCRELVLKGKEGSYVQKFAAACNIPFVSV